MELSQLEADRLFGLDKIRVSDEVYVYPMAGEKIVIPLVSVDRQEEFHLDFSRGSIRVTKATYQNRVYHTVILARLDVDGPPHQNPDGEIIPSPHLHRYREDFGDKWAERISREDFSDPTNLERTLNEFMAFCNISLAPTIVEGLFK